MGDHPKRSLPNMVQTKHSAMIYVPHEMHFWACVYGGGGGNLIICGLGHSGSDQIILYINKLGFYNIIMLKLFMWLYLAATLHVNPLSTSQMLVFFGGKGVHCFLRLYVPYLFMSFTTVVSTIMISFFLYNVLCYLNVAASKES